MGFEAGLFDVGHGKNGFAFDNESPRHKVLVNDFQLASRLTTNAEYLEFINDGGYSRPELWLSEGFERARSEQWDAPLYWQRNEAGKWRHYTCFGWMPLEMNAPVTHVSYFEADAFARWTDARLATEFEWEVAARKASPEGNFLEDGAFRPRPPKGFGLQQMFGDCWEWTSSSYAPYPGYQPATGALGEYNGKFMVNQYVLRGGSCATPRSHIRATYRNFFPTHARWQFSGIRLARSGK
jgi:ergothioneine biosynthesis protein EgtB